MADLGSAEVVLTAKVDQLLTGVNAAVSSLEKLGKQAEKSGKDVAKVSGVFSGFQGAMLKFNVATAAVGTAMNMLAGAANKLQALSAAADASKRMNAELTYLLQSSERAADAMARFYKVANAADISTAQAAGQFKKLATQTNLSNNQMESLITTFFQANKLMGKTFEEGAAGMNQLVIALQRGELSAGQLERAFRTTPGLIKILSEGLNVTNTELRQMAQDGKLTSDVLIKAFGDAGPAIKKSMEGFPLTIAEIFEQIDRITTKFGKDFMKAIFPDTDTKEFRATMESVFSGLEEILGNIISITKSVVSGLKSIGGVIVDVVGGFAKLITYVTGVDTSIKDIVKAIVSFAFPLAGV